MNHRELVSEHRVHVRDALQVVELFGRRGHQREMTHRESQRARLQTKLIGDDATQALENELLVAQWRLGANPG